MSKTGNSGGLKVIIFKYPDGTKDIVACKGISMEIIRNVTDDAESRICSLAEEVVTRLGEKGTLSTFHYTKH